MQSPIVRSGSDREDESRDARLRAEMRAQGWIAGDDAPSAESQAAAPRARPGATGLGGVPSVKLKFPSMPRISMEPGCENPFAQIIKLSNEIRRTRYEATAEYQRVWVEELRDELRQRARIEAEEETQKR